jgi:hypothetical protein
MAGTTRRQPGDEGSYAEEGPDEEGTRPRRALPDRTGSRRGGTRREVRTRGIGLTTRSDGVAVSNLVRVDLSGKSDPNTTIKHNRLACMHSITEGPLWIRLIVVRSVVDATNVTKIGSPWCSSFRRELFSRSSEGEIFESTVSPM